MIGRLMHLVPAHMRHFEPLPIRSPGSTDARPAAGKKRRTLPGTMPRPSTLPSSLLSNSICRPMQMPRNGLLIAASSTASAQAAHLQFAQAVRHRALARNHHAAGSPHHLRVFGNSNGAPGRHAPALWTPSVSYPCRSQQLQYQSYRANEK